MKAIKSRHLKGKNAWFYAEGAGLTVCAELHKGGRHVGTTVITIPWGRVRAALAAKPSTHRKP